MQVHRHYSKAPITEAIIDLKVAFPEGFSIDSLASIHALMPQIAHAMSQDTFRLITNSPSGMSRDNIKLQEKALRSFVSCYYSNSEDRMWIEPNVTASEEGDVVFEWWHHTKKLTVYIGNQSAEYVKVWGTDINSDMSDGDANPISTCRSLWEWLTGW